MTCAHRHRRAITVAVALLSLLLPVRAEAHLPSIGLGPVYDGIFHLLLSPEDLIPIIALALLAGQRGANSSRRDTVDSSGCLVGGWPHRNVRRNTARISLDLFLVSFGGRSDRRERETLCTTHHGIGHNAWLLPRIPERIRHQSLQRGRLLPFGTRSRRLRHRCALHIFRHTPSPAVGSHRRSRRGKLDRRQRPAHARLGFPLTAN